MSRLRVRIELNRGGVGVPLSKLASVVQQAQSFFRMLGDDVHIDQSQGEWLGFDFDHESLNFTAEFVGPVTPEQVAAFHAAFDGTTSLRRATIAQFAHIADAIEEDEVIGFGLYLGEGDDPAEWRCLSRRDALRIAEEIQVLLGAGQTGQESHLPAAGDTSTSARYLFGRRDRSVEAARLTGSVREMEASLSKRINRLEGEVAEHSGHIQDLRSKSVEAEQSMGRLLSAVEGFCEQAANRLETVTTPALAAGAARTPLAAPPVEEAPVPTQASSDAPDSPLRDEIPSATLAPSQWWRSPMVISVGLGTAVILLGLLFWPSGSTPVSTQVTSAKEPVRDAPVSAPATDPQVSSPASPSATPKSTQAKPATPAVSEKPAAPASQPVPKASEPAVLGATRIELEASEPSWVSIRSSDGTTQVARLIEAGNIQTVDIREPAVLRAGNAGGLTVRAHGKSIGPLGPHGVIRDVEFKDGEFKLVPVK
jgi:cytoskeleton protein RodZ